MTRTAHRDDGQRWRQRALCKPGPGHDPELWFPPPERPYATRPEHEAHRRRRIEQENKAKAVCRQCPVAVECLEYANNHDQREGIWGGLTPTERGYTPLR